MILYGFYIYLLILLEVIHIYLLVFLALLELVFADGAMDLVLFHLLIFMNMLRPKRVIFAQDNSHTKQQHSHHHNSYC